jgi:hypothetical protein
VVAAEALEERSCWRGDERGRGTQLDSGEGSGGRRLRIGWRDWRRCHALLAVFPLTALSLLCSALLVLHNLPCCGVSWTNQLLPRRDTSLPLTTSLVQRTLFDRKKKKRKINLKGDDAG